MTRSSLRPLILNLLIQSPLIPSPYPSESSSPRRFLTSCYLILSSNPLRNLSRTNRCPNQFPSASHPNRGSRNLKNRNPTNLSRKSLSPNRMTLSPQTPIPTRMNLNQTSSSLKSRYLIPCPNLRHRESRNLRSRILNPIRCCRTLILSHRPSRHQTTNSCHFEP